MTLNNQSATTAGTTSITATYNSSTISPSTITLASKSYTISGFTTAASRNSDDATVSSTSTLTSTATLNGYYTASSGGSKVLNAATTAAYPSSTVSGYLSSGAWVGTENKTLYAQFGSMPSKTLPTITKSGYTCGWTTSESGTTITYASGGSLTPTANTTLYGVCVANTATITLNKDGSAYSNSGMKVTLYNGTTETSYTQTVSSGSSASLSAVPAGTYNVYIGKDSNHKTTMIDSGVDVTVTSSGSEVPKATNVSAITDSGTPKPSAIRVPLSTSRSAPTAMSAAPATSLMITRMKLFLKPVISSSDEELSSEERKVLSFSAFDIFMLFLTLMIIYAVNITSSMMPVVLEKVLKTYALSTYTIAAAKKKAADR